MVLKRRTDNHTVPVVAIDLGSNSFHLLVAASKKGTELHPITTQAHKVQLALDMFDHRLTSAAIERGLECIKGLADFTQGLESSRVRVVGTQALRQATNQSEFIDPASHILGHPIDVVSGEEEAALAYYGVATELNRDQSCCAAPRLVIDIGGGSTELVVGTGDQVALASSVAVGCVSWLRYFPGGVINKYNVDAAHHAACEQFSCAAKTLGERWTLAVGCSGTLLAVEQVLIQQGWTQQGITRTSLAKLRDALLAFEAIGAVSFQGLYEERRSIFATGVVIVSALFEVFGLESMQLSSAGLREGIAWQLLHGR